MKQRESRFLGVNRKKTFQFCVFTLSNMYNNEHDSI